MFFKQLRDEIDGAMRRDPAARSRLEVALLYSSFHALVLHRLANALWRRGWRFLARAISQFARTITGIEIHPGATIGRRFFIDHGMGVVIGETAEIGDDVMLYHGVTLGGTSLSQGKRHPTIESGVIVGAGAKILGPITIGANARIGANAVVVKDVPAGASAVGIPARVIPPKEQRGEFMAYGTPTADLPDPVARAIGGLIDQIDRLGARITELEGKLQERVVPVATPPAAGDADADRVTKLQLRTRA
ncbi:MAG: serine O-acetyltransferase [Alphaproteobacteria bacterium]|nr:serine O-acetyltransferase [Alphaproteobacteria bacterium]